MARIGNISFDNINGVHMNKHNLLVRFFIIYKNKIKPNTMKRKLKERKEEIHLDSQFNFQIFERLKLVQNLLQLLHPEANKEQNSEDMTSPNFKHHRKMHMLKLSQLEPFKSLTKFVILLTINPTILIMLAQRI